MCFVLVFGLKYLKSVGLWVSFNVKSEVFFFLMFSFRNVKVAAQGHYCVSEEKTPLGWFKGRSNEMSYIYIYISSLCIFMNYCLVCDVTPW